MQVVGTRQDVPSEPVGQILTYEGTVDRFGRPSVGKPVTRLRASWSADRPFESGGSDRECLAAADAGRWERGRVVPGRRQRVPGNSQSWDADDPGVRGVGSSRDGPDRNRRASTVCCREWCPDTGRGAFDALHDHLVGDGVLAPRSGAENTRTALRDGGSRESHLGRRGTTLGSRRQQNGSTISVPSTSAAGDSPAMCQTGWQVSSTM